VIEVREVDRAAPGVTEDFLAAPRRLDVPPDPTRDAAAKALLAGTHALSPHCVVRAFVAYRDGIPLGRVLLTHYEGQAEMYLGFFECADDQEVSEPIFAAAERVAREAQVASIVGPVDASFWVRYRLKTSGFDNAPYFSEPVNPPHHLRLFQAAGYAVSDTYVSHLFPRAAPDHDFSAFDKQVDALGERGVRIASPRWWEWDRAMREIHALLLELYRDFPIFTPIDYAEFRAVFRGFRLITDLSMVFVARHEGEAVGFMVALPDYGVSLNTGSTLERLRAVARLRRRPERYVMLYLGAKPEYRGLGATMTGLLGREIVRRDAGAVGALIHEGKVTERYAPELVGGSNTYVLLRKEL